MSVTEYLLFILKLETLYCTEIESFIMVKACKYCTYTICPIKHFASDLFISEYWCLSMLIQIKLYENFEPVLFRKARVTLKGIFRAPTSTSYMHKKIR